MHELFQLSLTGEKLETRTSRHADHGCGQDVPDLLDVVQEEELAIQGLALLLRRPEG